jgi:hypothetical protein
MEQFFPQQPAAGNNRKHHRRIANGRRRLLVCLFAKIESALGSRSYAFDFNSDLPKAISAILDCGAS